MEQYFIYTLLISTLRLATPLLFAAMAGLWSERSGTIQIGLEGFMLIGALAAASSATLTNSLGLAILCGVLASILFVCLFAFFVLIIKTDQIVTGVATNLLAFGLAPLITKYLFNSTGSTPSLPLELRWGFEFLGLAVLATVFTSYVISKTRFGLWLRFAGESPTTLKSAGVSTTATRFSCLIMTGLLSGLGGASLSLWLASSYAPMMTAGRGFMALAALIFGGWRPVRTFLACLLFAFFDAIQLRLQGSIVGIPSSLIQVLPYIATIIALAGFFGHQKVPKALGRHS